jgi:PAS domain-containing protein
MTSPEEELEVLRGEVARLRAVEAELTQRVKRAEEELRASQAIHSAAIESLPFDFWARDRDDYCISQNATARANWGDHLHKRPEDMPLPKSVIDAWTESNRRALSGEIVRGDQQYTLKGETRHIHNILAPIRMGDAIVGTLGVNLDITDQKRAEAERVRALAALRESEEKLRIAVDAAGIGLWSWDPKTDRVTWEEPLCAIFGFPPDVAPVGCAGYLALVHSEDRAHAKDVITRGLQAGGWEDGYRIVRA